jgi:hypothetical protein
MVPQVRYQVFKGLLPFRRVYFVALIVGYALRRKCNGWVRASAGRVRRIVVVSKDPHRALKVVSTAFVGCFFPFPSFNFAFCSAGHQNINDPSNETMKGIHYREVGNFLFLLFRAFRHGRGHGSGVLRSPPAQRSAPLAPAARSWKLYKRMKSLRMDLGIDRI